MHKKTPPTTIGLLDSGIGGLSIIKKLLQDSTTASTPTTRNYLYIADTAHLPYGNKSPEYLIARGRALTNFFISQGISTIIVACHTSSATALATLRLEFPEISYIDLIPYTIDHAVAHTKNKRIGVLATQATINSGIHTKLLLQKNSDFFITTQACPLFVQLIESNAPATEILQAIKLYMQPLVAAQVDTVILGCTHYEFIRDYLEQYAPSLSFISAAQIDLLEAAQLGSLSLIATGPFTHTQPFIQTLIGPYAYDLEQHKSL